MFHLYANLHQQSGAIIIYVIFGFATLRRLENIFSQMVGFLMVIYHGIIRKKLHTKQIQVIYIHGMISNKINSAQCSTTHFSNLWVCHMEEMAILTRWAQKPVISRVPQTSFIGVMSPQLPRFFSAIYRSYRPPFITIVYRVAHLVGLVIMASQTTPPGIRVYVIRPY